MDGKSLDIAGEKRDKLREIIPEAFTENKIDWEKLKAALGDDIEFKNERYVLNWAGKSDAFRALQAPSTDTLVPCKDEPSTLIQPATSLLKVKIWKCSRFCKKAISAR